MRRVARLMIVPALVVLAACSAGFPPPVPDPMPESIPLPPVSAEPLRWRPGYWNWTGTGYSWVTGEYVPQSKAGTMWMPGQWTRSPSGQVWKPPHWVN